MKKFVEWTNFIFEKIRGRLIKFALVKIFGRVIGGFWGWIATEILGRLIDKVIKPGWNYITRKARVFFVKKKTKKKAKRMEEAKSESDFDDSFDDLP